MDRLSWLDEVEYEDLLSSDMKLIRDRCGDDVLRRLLSKIPSIYIYVSEKPIQEAKKRYINKFYTGTNAKELAARLECSERFVYEVSRKRSKSKKTTQESLF